VLCFLLVPLGVEINPGSTGGRKKSEATIKRARRS